MSVNKNLNLNTSDNDDDGDGGIILIKTQWTKRDSLVSVLEEG